MQACWFRRCVQKVTRQVLYIFLLTTEPQVNITPFKAVPLVRHTPPETLLPFPVAVLDVFMWKCPQLVCHDLLGVVHSTKTATFEVEFEFRGMEEDTRTQIKRVWGLRNRWNTVFGQKLVQGNGSLTGRVVVLQHPSVRNVWPDTMNPFAESFKDLTIVLLINCLSLRHQFLTNSTLTVERTDEDGFDFSICSLLLSSGAVICSCATPKFVVRFRDRTRISAIHHLL